jgi:hypothetical protein
MAARIRSRSTGILLLALAFTGGATTAVVLRHRIVAGVLALIGGAVMLLGWFATDREKTARARFAAMIIDPVFDTCILAAIAWVSRTAEPTVAALALVALGTCYVAAYERARADALGFRTFESVGYRAARSALIGLALVTGWMAAALWVLVAISAVAVAVRAMNVAIQHRSSPGAVPGAGAPAAGTTP